MLFPWRNHEVSIIFWGHELKFYMDYDAEAGGKVLLNENDVECIALLQLSNRKADSYVKLNVKMEDYYRIKDAEKKADE